MPVVPSVFCEERLGLQLDEWQKQIMDGGTRRHSILGARQCGKSTAVAGLAVHRMLTQPGYQVVVFAASNRQSILLVDKCKWMLRKLGFTKLRGDGSNAHSLRLPNGSGIVALPCSPKTIRGFTANLLVLDEAAFVPDALYLAVRPMLAATDGDLLLMSTADEPVGFFWEIMTRERGDTWKRTTIVAEQVSRFHKAFLEEERRELGEEKYRREYDCKFGDGENGLFLRKVAERALRNDVPPLFTKR